MSSWMTSSILSTLFSEAGFLLNLGLTGLVTQFALRSLCLPHLRNKVTGWLSSRASSDVCTADLISGLMLWDKHLAPSFSFRVLGSPGVWGKHCGCHGF